MSKVQSRWEDVELQENDPIQEKVMNFMTSVTPLKSHSFYLSQLQSTRTPKVRHLWGYWDRKFLVGKLLGEILWFCHFVWVRQLADADCVISIEYYSELLNHVSKNWEVLAQRKYTDNGVFDLNYNWYIFVSQELPNFLSRDLVTLNNTLSISHSPRPLAAGTIQNAKIMESLLRMQQKKSIPSVWFIIVR